MKRELERQYAKAFLELVFEKNQDDVGRISKTFFAFLKKKRAHFSDIKSIVDTIERMSKEQSGVCDVSAYVAFEITNDLHNLLNRYAKELFQSEKIHLDIIRDKEILGGFILKTENEIMDASMRRRLREARKQLVNM